MRISTVMRWLGAVLLTVCLVVAPAQGRSRSRRPQQVGEGPPTIAWVIAAVFLAGSLAIVFKNPRRTHQG